MVIRETELEKTLIRTGLDNLLSDSEDKGRKKKG